MPEIIKIETAKLAKEKDFDEPVVSFFENGNEALLSDGNASNINSVYWKVEGTSEWYSAPTQSELQKWLRDKHNILVSPITAFSQQFIEDRLVFTFKPCIEKLISVGENLFYREIQYEMFHGLEPMGYEQAFELALYEGLKLIEVK